MLKVDWITILPLLRDEEVRSLDSTKDQSEFGAYLRKWLDRPDVIIVLECHSSDGLLEVGIALSGVEMRLATHVFGDPSIASQLQLERPEDPPMPDWAPLKVPGVSISGFRRGYLIPKRWFVCSNRTTRDGVGM